MTITSPACERYVGAVGSAKYILEESSFVISSFSSRGPTLEGFTKPDVVMFGEDIIMASSESDTATIAKSGTSFSTPFISGSSILYQEGWMRAPVRYPYSVWGYYPELQELPGIDTLIDRYLEQVSAKPQGAPSGKDNEYGYGIILGSLVAQALGAAPAVGISDALSVLTPLLAIGMVGMMMGSMAKGTR